MQWLHKLFRLKSAADRAAGVAKKINGHQLNGKAPDEVQFAKKEHKPGLLDSRVIISMLLVMVLGMGLLSFKIFTYKKCSFPEFETKAEFYTAGELIQFTDKTNGGQSWVWNFGDGTDKAVERNPLHVYKMPGEYIVKLVVNDRCTIEKKIAIRPFFKPVDSLLFPNIIAPLAAKMGTPVQFTNTTSAATSWNWRFGESNALSDDRSKSPVYVFRTPGFKVVSLYINGNTELVAQHKIFISPEDIRADMIPPMEFMGKIKPVKPTVVYVKDDSVKVTEIPETPSLTAVKPKAPAVTETQLKEILLRISEQKNSIEDLMPYCCRNYGLPVRANGKSTMLEIFCNKIRGKKVVIKDVETMVNDQTGCIEQINISYKIKKGFLDIF